MADGNVKPKPQFYILYFCQAEGFPHQNIRILSLDELSRNPDAARRERH